MVDDTIRNFTKVRSSEDGWSHYYRGNANDEWVLTTYESEYHGGVIPILKKLPQPSIEKLIEIALESKDINDITGASIELSEREKYGNEEFREELLTRLLLFDASTCSEFDIERLKTIIYESDLYDPTNRKKILGKHWTEVNKDAEFYRSISERAKTILNKIKERTGE